jgi:hypothetical protein
LIHNRQYGERASQRRSGIATAQSPRRAASMPRRTNAIRVGEPVTQPPARRIRSRRSEPSVTLWKLAGGKEWRASLALRS